MQRNVATAHPDDDVEKLVRLLRKHELPGIPVVDGEGKVVGIVTEADLVIREEDADIHLPHHIDLLGGVIFLESTKRYEERLRKALSSTVGDMMTPDPVTIRPEDSVHDAARLIATRRHNRLPVTDADDRLLGVVTRLDVLEALTQDQ